MGQIIADIEKNNKEIIRVEVSEFKGRELINLRIWFYSFDGEYRPTQKGVTIDVSKFEELKKAIHKIDEYLKDKDANAVPDLNVPIDDAVVEDTVEDKQDKKEE
jgi:hypothetical protein